MNDYENSYLHSIISWSLATLWGDPVNVLVRVLNVTGFAVNAVLCIDL